MLKLVRGETDTPQPGSVHQTYERVIAAGNMLEAALAEVDPTACDVYDALYDSLDRLAIVRGRLAELAFMNGELRWQRSDGTDAPTVA